jgi:hypothetical protein
VTTPADVNVTIYSGEFAADGASPTGNITGTEDIGAPSGASLGAGVNATYSISSNGRGTIQGGIAGVVYVISPSKFMVASLSAPNSAISLFEH